MRRTQPAHAAYWAAWAGYFPVLCTPRPEAAASASLISPHVQLQVPFAWALLRRLAAHVAERNRKAATLGSTAVGRQVVLPLMSHARDSPDNKIQ